MFLLTNYKSWGKQGILSLLVFSWDPVDQTNCYTQQTNKQTNKRVNETDIFEAVRAVFSHCHGGYACTAMIAGYGIIGFRDPNGIRPLIYGKRETHAGVDYIVSSESVVLDSLGFSVIADVAPGSYSIILTYLPCYHVFS